MDDVHLYEYGSMTYVFPQFNCVSVCTCVCVWGQNIDRQNNNSSWTESDT